ncbi:hypothetical protein MRX96_025277 [Rhipicephalus microplus]
MAGLARRCLVLAVFSCCSLAAALALVVFGNGATWERELPVCASERSACSLIHRRYWQSPLEIRLCRCPRKEPCPEGFETATNASAFNVTARTQLKMCSGWQAPPIGDVPLHWARIGRPLPSGPRKQLGGFDLLRTAPVLHLRNAARVQAGRAVRTRHTRPLRHVQGVQLPGPSLVHRAAELQ